MLFNGDFSVAKFSPLFQLIVKAFEKEGISSGKSLGVLGNVNGPLLKTSSLLSLPVSLNPFPCLRVSRQAVPTALRRVTTISWMSPNPFSPLARTALAMLLWILPFPCF